MTPLYDRASSIVRGIYHRRFEGPPVLNLDSYFPNAARFAGAWQAIRTEALAIAGNIETVPRFHEILPEQASLSAQDGHDWRVFILKAYGIDVPKNLARCPTLAALLRQTPEVLSATLSCLGPRKHIPPHCGPFRGVVKYHLGLAMPKGQDGRPAAVLTIAGHEYHIADGEYLLWDDTYPHEALNASDEVRIALVLEVCRRSMSIDMELFSRLLVAVVRAVMKFRGVSYGQ